MMNAPEALEIATSETDQIRYFPLANGRYEVKPGFFPFGSDFGNGLADQQIFQIDAKFADYHRAKLRARAERLEKYYQTCHYLPGLATYVTRLMLDRFTQEHPDRFHLHSQSGQLILDCALTQESLHFDEMLQQVQPSSVTPPYQSALDALATQVQEDLAIVCRCNGSNWLSAIHLCYPNYWTAEEKIGQDFATIHAPVAQMEPINQRSTAILNTMIARGPFVRFAWGLATDTRLNHHPKPPPGISQAAWLGRCFDRTALYLRIERQVIWGLPAFDAALFTIRTYFRDCYEIKRHPKLRSQLYAAIASMSPESLAYKGLTASHQDILTWLSL